MKYGTSSGSYTEQASVATNSTTKTISDLAPGVTYYFVVTAKNVANLESDPSNEISYTVPGTRANATPIATSISTNTVEDQPKSIRLTGTDADGDTLTFSIATSPTKGTLSGTPPNVTYRPNSNYFGSDSFTFRVNDGQANSATATVSIAITAVNDAPTISPIANQTVELNTPTSAIPFVVGDLETAASSLTLTATSSDQSLVPNSNIKFAGSGANRTVTATPANNKSGVATITVFVADGSLDSSTTFRLTVDPGNTAPIATSISTNTAEDQPKSIRLTGTDADGDTLTFSIATSPTKGTLSGTPPNVTYRPNSNYFGSDSFTFRVNDGQANSTAATVSISVTAVNDAPTISPIANQTVELNTPTSAIPFVVGDLETAASSLTLTATSSDQSLVPNSNIKLAGSGANRTVTATPANNQLGVATITVFVADGSLGSSTTFRLTVDPENTAPEIVAASSIATESYVDAEVPVVVTDHESPPGDLTLSAASMNTTVLPDSNISFSGSGSNRVMKCRPVPGKSGQAVVHLSVSDGRAITRRALQLNVQLGTAPTSRLSIVRNGRGSVKPALDGEILTIGKTYSILAIPASDELFLEWRRGATSSLPKITFTMTSNLVLEVTFTNNPFTERKGLYNGLFYETAEVRDGSSGSITLTSTERGTYSGKLRIGKANYPISGSQDLALRSTNNITRRGTNDLVVEFDFGSRSNQIVGRVMDGLWIADIVADRAVYKAKDNDCPFAGRYTIIIPGQTQPGADGFGTIKVDDNGLASLAGILADGTKISCKSSLSRLGQWPVYCVTSGGTVLSWMTFAERPTDDVTGLMSWIKPTQSKSKYYPGGLTNETLAVGSSFVRPVDLNSPLLDLTDTTISFTGGDVTPAFSNEISWGTNNKITNLSENKLALSINSSSGLFKGSVTDPGSLKTSKFAGALLQKRNYGSGFMLGIDRSALVVIGERPSD